MQKNVNVHKRFGQRSAPGSPVPATDVKRAPHGAWAISLCIGLATGSILVGTEADAQADRPRAVRRALHVRCGDGRTRR